MDPNELLATARAEFMRTFIEAANQSILYGVDALYKKADMSHSSEEQGWLMTARSVLRARQGQLVQQMGKEMEHLLNRSFQTTYSTFRPKVTVDTDSLRLVESSALEDELRINQLTQNFRNEAEEQLRDLNIRIALLFEQDNISERENPFRPYLFSKAVANAVAALDQSEVQSSILTSQLAESLTQHVAYIYNCVNSYFAQHGIAAQLQLKIKKSPDGSTPMRSLPGDVMAGTGAFAQGAPMYAAPAGGAPAGPAEFGMQPRGVAAPPAAEVGRNAIEQLMNSVRMLASGVPGLAGPSAARAPGGVPPALVHPSAYPAGLAAGGASGGAQMPAMAGQATAASVPASGAQESWLAGSQALGEVLRRLFSVGSGAAAVRGAGDAVGQADAGQSIYFGAAQRGVGGALQASETALTQALGSLHRQHAQQAGQLLDTEGQVRNLLLEQRTELSREAKGVDEQMTIDVVAMLFEFILRDTQVPAEIRAQLGRLQFLVLKLALRDGSLLKQHGHPVRLLINRIGSVSLGLQQVDPGAAHVTEEICRIVAALLEDPDEDPATFVSALDELDTFIAHELRSRDDQVEKAVQAVEQAENRTLRFAHTSAQMAQALADLTIDPFLKEFLQKDWVQAIEHAGRSDEKRSRRYRLMVPDLLWSIVPKPTSDDRTQLSALLPILLTTLRDGLAQIGWDKARQQDLLNWLVDAHTSALRAAPSLLVPPSLPQIHAHFDHFVDNPEQAAEEVLNAAELPGRDRFLEQAIHELDVAVQRLDQVFDEDQQLPKFDPLTANTVAREAEAAANKSVLERLQNGVALEITLGNKPAPARLSWISPSGTDLVLTLEGQATPSMMSVQMFRRLLEHGRVRFLETEPLFERAVQALLKSADEISHAQHAVH